MSNTDRDHSLDALLNLDGFKYVYPNLYWYKVSVRLVEPTDEIPHGIRYNLTFHDKHGTRIFGMDNKHIPKNRRRGFHGRIVEYDHVHHDVHDKGTAYAFVDAQTLMQDFFERIDEILRELEG